MFIAKKEIRKRQNSNGTICAGGICHILTVKQCRGSFSIEAALVFPLIMLCFCLAIQIGISLQEEIKVQTETFMKKEPLDISSCMYRKEYFEDVIGAFYED